MVVIAYRQARDAPHAPPPHGPHIRASACGTQAGCIATQGALEHERSHRSRLGKLHRYPPPSGWPWSGYRCYGPISMRLQPAYLAVKSVWSDSNLQEARNSMVLRYKRIAGVVDASGDAPKRIEMYWNMRDEAQIARAHAR